MTVSHKARQETIDRARHYGDEWELPYVKRDDRPVSELGEQFGALLVFTNAEVLVATTEGQLRFHLGTAFIRLKSLERGDGDTLVTAAQAQAGDTVLDTTLGLARDSRVIARAIGETGRVHGIESSPPLFHLAQLGFENTDRPANSAPITVELLDARQYLRSLETDSFDIVIIDPMFPTPTTSDAGFSLLRHLADGHELTAEWVQDARRVARRSVVVKAAKSHPWFGEVGLEWVPSNANAAWYRTSRTQ